VRDLRVEIRDAVPADDYLDLIPDSLVRIPMLGDAPEVLKGHVEAENAPDGARIRQAASEGQT